MDGPKNGDEIGAPQRSSLFLVGYEKYKILRPSKAYTQACLSYPCRISELIFGSLLAAYILGFINAGVSQQKGDANLGWLVTSMIFLNYLMISVSFSFLTAALYTTYHNSILTMPNVPIADLTTDFLIAILQAVCFGVTMIWPHVFLICLGTLLILAYWRQEVKFQRLGKFFYDHCSDSPVPIAAGRDKSNKPKPVRGKFASDLKEVNSTHANCLAGWAPIKLSQYFYAGILFVCGMGIALGLHAQFIAYMTSKKIWPTLVDADRLQTLIYIIMVVIFIIGTISILKAKSVALDDDGRMVIERMDEAATALVKLIIAKTPPPK